MTRAVASGLLLSMEITKAIANIDRAIRFLQVARVHMESDNLPYTTVNLLQSAAAIANDTAMQYRTGRI